MVDKNVLNAFEMMWGPFPEPVLLIRKDRTILAVNAAARAYNMPVGVKCSSLNPENRTDGHCQRCLAPAALKTGTARTNCKISPERSLKVYWMPLKDVPDVYVHFGINITGDIAEATAGTAAASQA